MVGGLAEVIPNLQRLAPSQTQPPRIFLVVLSGTIMMVLILVLVLIQSLMACTVLCRREEILATN